jgi:hypothetical protein
MVPIPAGSYKNITATGAVSTVPGVLTGFYVNSTTSGVIVFRDGGSGGTVLNGDNTPAIGWHFLPTAYGSGGLHLTLVSGAINLTVVFNSTPIT